LNCTLSVAVCPGFNVIGNIVPDTLKPLPVSAAALIVTASLPVEVNVTNCVAAVFSATPWLKSTVVGLRLSVRTAAFSFRAKLLETPPKLAVSVAACAVVTDVTLAVN
jgi:hypothetical protein